jgi:enamine deaminase RidA (YjgF/YER057c/UK114 family)
MKNNIALAACTCRLSVRPSARESFTEYHVTATVDGHASAGEAAEAIFTRVAALLLDKGIQPIQEKLYGLSSVREDVLAVRDDIFRSRGLDRTMPVTWIEGMPLNGCEFVGIQLWGVAPHGGDIAVVTVEDPVNGRARLWTGVGFRMLHLPSVRATTLADDPADQARQMFLNVRFGLQSHGFKYTDVARTWIYCAHLLDWYGDLNRVRTAIYHEAGLGIPGGAPFPASTGIMGRTNDEACLVDVLAFDAAQASTAKAIPIHRSPRQDSSFNYGSAFSRGMVIEIEGRRTVHISGTASINSAGESTYLGDAEHQSLDTLMSIAAILEEQGGSLQNITSATLFCKTRTAWEAWERATRLLGIPNLPKVCVLADVCRDNLLVEMEAVAVI